ncbi:hypothetical protein AOS92_001005 [Enterococcus faecalis]|nr:hypothetical protein [Enterococcus faecalis]
MNEDEIELIKQVVDSKGSKRAKLIVDYIIKNGSITTSELENLGYSHPPRAARDVRDIGIPLITQRVTNPETGKRQAKYVFGKFSDITSDRMEGRKNFPVKFKNELFDHFEGKCAICSGHYSKRVMQIDHRIPFSIAGDSGVELNAINYMMICPSDNRAKSYSCENCENWLDNKDIEVCRTCYWARPENYTHIEMQQKKSIQILFENETEIEFEKKLEEKAVEQGLSVQELIKKITFERITKEN